MSEREPRRLDDHPALVWLIVAVISLAIGAGFPMLVGLVQGS